MTQDIVTRIEGHAGIISLNLDKNNKNLLWRIASMLIQHGT